MSYPNKYLTGATGRQLMDLRKRPSVATIDGKTVPDNRPYFDLGELPESSPDYGKTMPFRQLLWHPTTGEEVCATTQSEVNSYHNRGYLDFPPHSAVINPVRAAQDELASLSQADRQRVLDAVHRQRLERIQAQIAKLSDAELEEIQTAPADRKMA